MQKKYVAASTLFLMLSLFASLSLTPISSAYDNDNNCASNLYTTNWLQWNGEAQTTATAFSQIETLFSQKYVYYWGYPYMQTYGELINWGSGYTPSDVYNRIDHDNAYHSYFATALYVGHGGPQGFYCYSSDPDNPNNPPTPFAVFQDDPNGQDIRSHTINSPTYQFAFMWVCMGYESFPAGSTTSWDPLWWSNPPAYPDYTWIGFQGFSPWLSSQMNPGNTYKNWLVFFYYYALTNGVTIMQALNYASQAAGCQNFASSPLGQGYSCYWPYEQWIQGIHITPGDYSGHMEEAGNPLEEQIPADYSYP
ncbi:MAG: hypothetical protein ACQCN4_00050 [Candidatus Bathyarchaeia archaeon]